MSKRGLLSFVWKEHLHPYFVAIQLMPFMLLFFALNVILKRVPAGAVLPVKFLLRVGFGFGFVYFLCVGIFSLLDYLGWVRFGWLHGIAWRPFCELVMIWLAGGMLTLYGLVTHGNWQIRKPVA